jgi:hypothetical protein
MKLSTIAAALITATASLGATAAFAQDAYAIPNAGSGGNGASGTVTDGSGATTVNYVTGGIGDDERQAIEASKGDYNLHVTSASGNGAFVEDTQVVIKDKAGTEVLNVTAGPLLYVKLPTGSYTLEATHGSDSQTKKFVIGKKPTRDLHLSWKVPALVTE